MEWKKVHGTQDCKPQEVDFNSSEQVVYLRKNIALVSKETEQGTETYWEYDELAIDKNNPKGVYLILGELLQSQNNQDLIMMALADIYEKLEA